MRIKYSLFRICAITLSSLVGLILGGCDKSSSAPASPLAGRNVVLISLDTLRADRLGIYGYQRQTSPAIDSFARRGALFENVVSESSWTLPSHVTMLTALHPLSHKVDDRGRKIGGTLRMVQEILAAKGFRTLGFADGGYLSRSLGFNRGFQVYEDKREGLQAKLPKLIKALDGIKVGERFFAFLHTYDIHCPYHPPEPYYSMFQSEGAEKIKTKRKCGATFFNKKPRSRGELLFLSDRYDGKIRWTDNNLSPLFEYLDRRKLLENTYVIILSDHGESFGEHGLVGHQRSLHRELLSVPMIVVGPGIVARRIAQPVGLSDLTPTVLSLLGLQTEGKVDGTTLLPILFDWKSLPDFPSFRVSSLEREVLLRSVADNRFHLIQDPSRKLIELFDMASDPREQNNLASTQADVVRAMNAQLDAAVTKFSDHGGAEHVEQEDEELEQLKSLGYVN